MNDLRAMHGAREEWEDWSDGGNTIAPKPRQPDVCSHAKPSSRRSKAKVQAATTLQRLRSRRRQQHQNEKAGIRLVTDMERFRQGPQQVAVLVQPAAGPVSSEAYKVTGNKFADASALRALEGSPNLGSMGNWAWLKDNRLQARDNHEHVDPPLEVHVRSTPSPTPDPPRLQFSPDGNKIVIGLAVPEHDAAARIISPQTATVASPTSSLRFPDPPQSAQPVHSHQSSAWSPDTDDGYSPARHQQHSIHGHPPRHNNTAQPMPAIPSHLRSSTKANEVDDDDDDDDDDDNDDNDDNFTPVTLFEEDGTKTPASAVSNISPETTRSRSGWWDHVKTPFKERFSPTSRFEAGATSAGPTAGPTSPGEWWKGADTKAAMPPQHTASDASSSAPRPTVPILREPSPTMVSSSRSSPPASLREQHHEPRCEKSAVDMDEHADPSDVPPPYEPTPSGRQGGRHAMFPQSHHLATQFPPSQTPGSPGLDGAITAQGARRLADMKMSDVPLTPARIGAQSAHPAEAPLPDRVAGTYVGDHHQEVRGASPAAQIEKTRRRHEKEDYLARKVGGFGKGRACLNGCYGRSGREGRQRRRWWLLGCLVLLALIITGVVVGVVVSRQLQQRVAGGDAAASTPTSSASPSSATPSPETSSSNTQEKTTSSVWLNLTSFPPIPTGLATVVGPDNSEAISGCVAPETLWSCALPPEEQAANKPSEPEEPMFIFQIQYDNNTRMLWNVPNGDPPTPSTSSTTATSTSSSSSSSFAASTEASTKTSSATSTATSATVTNDLYGSDPGRRLARRGDDNTLYDTGIAPNPAPPSFNEMWFLGNWTDGIVSANKSGEPTPFYISFFTSLTDSAGPNMLTDDIPATTKRKRQGGSLTDDLPAPLVKADGTGQSAQLRPFPFQQPLRLYDRGLPTEHYGFYSFFNKTIYAASMANTSVPSSADEGGVRETSAEWYAAWTQTRFVVKIWTRKGSAAGARLIGGATGDNVTAPGSFAYPITIGEDTHGGDLQLKKTFAYAVGDDQVVNATLATTFVNDIGYESDVVNAAYPDGDLSWGGTDGGTGGCRCEWVNWVTADGAADETFA